MGDDRRRSGSRDLPDHRGLATWGERLVPLERFAREAAAHGRALDAPERRAALERFTAAVEDPTPIEGPFERIAVFGGVYNNAPALEALLERCVALRVDAIYCLGDLGGFGPRPERIRPLLEAGGVRTIQGNYETSLAAGADDCNCGYTDPRDNHYAELSYRYTAERCDDELRAWMGALPARRRLSLGGRELLLVHGSPRRINEFLFASTSPVPFLTAMLDRERADAVLCTHTGLPWHRRLPDGRDAINVGVIGRPANDGTPEVRFALLEAGATSGAAPRVELLPLTYDHLRLAGEMRAENLPEPFVETILSGWWTTCLEVLPARERAASRF